MKRLISSTASEIMQMTKAEKLLALRSSEGRIMVAEMTVGGSGGALENASMGELYSSFGADMLLLNKFDVFHPTIPKIDSDHQENVVKVLKRYTGTLVGVNLEPVSYDEDMPVERVSICEGRLATAKSAKQALVLGMDYIVLTGNPDTGVTNKAIVEATRVLKQEVGNEMMIIAGKMHAAGSIEEAGTNLISRDTISELVEAGADVILLPAPGTVPGVTLEYVRDLVEYCHQQGVMTLTAIGTSQEDADKETIRRIALMCKMTGTDLHHIGDAGHADCTAESIMAYSIVIRGKRHTYNRMATSVMR